MSSIGFIQNPWIADRFSTSDATPTVSTVASYTVPTGAVGSVIVNFSGKDGSGNGVDATLKYSFQNPAGTVTLSTVSAVAPLFAIGGILTAVVLDVIVVSSNIIKPRVTGIIATPITWQLDALYRVN